ncbi:hypothetical protein ACIRSU_34075 [Streptomyces sp. NPDC101160]|uniref:hypothetical protein n=1 Tax=Streptomyces sp. NPDC101160 TaxID=3366118 RepID=UPI00382FAEDF
MTGTTPPYQVGDYVTGTSYVPPERRHIEQPEQFEGDVVQVGSGYAGVDADRAYVWVRVADGTERQALIDDVERAGP